MFQLLGLLVLTLAGGIAQVDGAVNWYGYIGISNTTTDVHYAHRECSDNGGNRMIYDSDEYSTVFKDNALLGKKYWYENLSDQTSGVCWTMRYNGETVVHTRHENSCYTEKYRYLCYRYDIPPPSPCLEGQVKRSSLPGLCFKYVAEKMNMSEAAEHCTTLTGATGASGHIMEMTDVARHELAMEIDQDIQIWIGNKKNEAGDWIWVYSGSTLNDAQARWNPGEPSGDGDCVNTYLYDREKWTDTLCRIKRAFICEFEARA